jgi:hypothetical protein
VSWEDIPIRFGHAPDLPRTNPDGWRIYNAWPMPGGIGTKVKFSLCTASASVSAAPNGGFEAVVSSGAKKYYVGLPTKIFQWDGALASPTWTDRSATAYGASTATTWSFAQFGDLTFAANLNDRLQYASTGAFTQAASVVPKADIVIACGPATLPFIMLLDYDDGTNHYADGWFASPTPNATWSAAVSAQIVNGRLLIPTGKLSAGVAFRDGAVAFKKQAMFLGEYGDEDAIWTWKTVARAVGCVGKNAVCSAEDVVFFVGPRGFYVFDGSYPRKLPGHVHDEWAAFYESKVSGTWDDYVYATYDTELSIFTVNVAQARGTKTRSWHFNTISNKWTTGEGANDSDTPSGSQPIVMMGPRHGASFCRPAKIDTQATPVAVAEAVFNSPRFGSAEHGAHLAGVWPTFKAGTRWNNNLGPNSTASWTSFTDNAYAVVFNGYNRPHASAFTSRFTATLAETSIGRATGHVQGQWVDVDFTIAFSQGPELLWEIESVALDLQRSGKK